MKLFHALFLSIIALALSSCAGYHVGVGKPKHLAKIEKLAVPTFKNETLEPRLTVLMTNALIKQLQIDGSYKITSKDKADGILECRIRRIIRTPFRSVRTNVLVTSELQLYMYVEYKLLDATTRAPLHAGLVTGSSSIVLDPNFHLSEHQAMEEASVRIASQLVSEIAEGW